MRPSGAGEEEVGDEIDVSIEAAEGDRGASRAVELEARTTNSVVIWPAAESWENSRSSSTSRALGGIHLFEDGDGAFFGELGEEVGGGGGVHLLDDAGDGLGVEGFDEGLLELGFDLFEGLGGDLFVEAAEESPALGRSEVFKDVGDVGGVHLREAIVLHLEADTARGVAIDEVDELPGDDVGAEAAGDALDGGVREAFEEAADGAAEADLDTSWMRRDDRVVASG